MCPTHIFFPILGWRTVSVQEIVNQSKSLCGQFIRIRLKRNGVQNKRMGLQRLRSMLSLNVTGPTSQTVCEVFAQLHIIGLELERINPNLYLNICRQVSDSQCGKFMIFLPFRFYVNSILGILEVQNLPF